MPKWFVLIIAAGIIAGGCGKENQNDGAASSERRIQTEQLGTHEAEESPQSLNNQQAGEASVTADIKKAKAIIWEMKGYTPRSVMVNGEDMWIDIHTTYRLNHRERMEKESIIWRRLLKALPQYDMYVKIEAQ
ncbi:hypothetical protein [Heyndrickxia acidiproducens]|uniref:hypothetical protein n=1 Tax=Heyndrickxia acidiproducens TaxID=1121084 RepID=UPI000361262F|nr:hypothetical protein [Heyndrickxia acidiproducens]